MTYKKQLCFIILSISFAFMIDANAQITEGAYISTTQNTTHELKISDDYLILSAYSNEPAEFIKTMGGFYTIDNNTLQVKLEFNSNFETDGIKEVSIPFVVDGDQLTFQTETPIVFAASKSSEQDLDGQWLFATRGPDKGQDRRGEESARKTLKFLMNGRFQWIAYHTETFKFSGTGGGAYSSVDGVYTENIEYFSRDNKRVGASLNFNYERKENDWHHTGNNSKGEPMYEIWARRE